MSTLLDEASLIVTPNGAKSGKLYSVVPSSGAGDFTVTRATTATRVNSSVIIESVGANIPRLDYSNGSCPSILLEPQRTNLFTDSETYSVNWGSNFTSITKNLLSPSGQTTASTMVNNIGLNTSIYKLIPVVSGNTYKLTFYIKKISGSWTSANGLRLSSWGAAVASQTYTDIGTTVTSDWVRYTHTFTATSTGNVNCQLISNELHTFGLWGAQLEAGAYSTSYIPTTSASVTRNADSITRNNIYTNGFITAAGGTWFVELSNNRVLTRDNGNVSLYLGDSLTPTSGNGLYILNGGSVDRLSIYKRVAGSGTFLFTTTTNTSKIVIKWNGATADIFQNGVKVVTATAFATTLMENIYSASAGPCQAISINEMALFPTPLTDAQCQQLTTL